MKKNCYILLIISVTIAPLSFIIAETTDIKTAVIDLLKCTGCGDCGKICPVKAITFENDKAVVDPAKCINCLLCVKTCKFNAPHGKREIN